jgi:hypothetical protein
VSGCVCMYVYFVCVSADAQTSASAQILAQISVQTLRSVQMIRSVCVCVCAFQVGMQVQEVVSGHGEQSHFEG